MTNEFDKPNDIFPDVDALAPLVAAVESSRSDTGQNSIGLGFRWDFRQKFAFKTQVERIERKERGISFDRLPDDDGKEVTLFSAVFDFVF